MNPRPRAYAYAMDERPWQAMPRAGVREKAVRRDAESGQYLGLVAFEPMTRSGLHQHLGTALSYFCSGSLTDYQGSASEGMLGVNLAGTTHDAYTYSGCLLASRLEGPVVVPEDEGAPAHPIRGANAATRIRNPNPGRAPDINIPLAPLAIAPSGFPGVGRRMVFDYAGTGDVRRTVALSFTPHAPELVVAHEGLADWFVIGGDLKVGGERVRANSFVVFEPGARVAIASEYGCLALCWAEAPAWGEFGPGRAELYGF